MFDAGHQSAKVFSPDLDLSTVSFPEGTSVSEPVGQHDIYLLDGSDPDNGSDKEYWVMFCTKEHADAFVRTSPNPKKKVRDLCSWSILLRKRDWPKWCEAIANCAAVDCIQQNDYPLQVVTNLF